MIPKIIKESYQDLIVKKLFFINHKAVKNPICMIEINTFIIIFS